MGNVEDFDASEHEPQKEYGVIKPGRYLAVMTAAPEKETKAKDGSKYFDLEFTIQDGEYKNRKVWHKLNLGNKSQDARNVAKGQLSSICHAVGVMKPLDLSNLYGRPMSITVRVKDKYLCPGEFVNTIASWGKKELAEGKPAQTASGHAPAAGDRKAWE